VTLPRLLSVAAALFAAAGAAQAQRWEMRYFYDESRSALTINDLAFPTARRGVAVGEILDTRRDRVQGAAVVTSDGGATWSVVRLPETGISVFFLDETTGWVVTHRRIYRTDEGGRSWRRLPRSPRDAVRVWFLDPDRGYAVGAGKSVHQTEDGGRSWKPLPAVGQIKTNPDHTVFTSIAFTGPLGYITGWSRPPRRDQSHLPDWMEPEKAVARREWPNTSIVLGTTDGGKTWEGSSASIVGQISRIRMSGDGRVLSVLEFRHAAPYAGEVIAVDSKTGGSQRVFHSKEHAVWDVAVPASGPTYVAASAVAGRLKRSPIPARLYILKSDDLKVWKAMEVDYRANARSAVMAAVDAQNVWVATDTGMILKLVP
jgi:hypothetical protein